VSHAATRVGALRKALLKKLLLGISSEGNKAVPPSPAEVTNAVASASSPFFLSPFLRLLQSSW
jgi:hypothetical protein